MPDRLKFSILVVSYNSSTYLPRCLEALQKQTVLAESYEIIVVDNASDDFDTQIMCANYPGLRIEKFSNNLGFAVANNRAAQMARGEWLVLINPDAFAAPDMLQAFDQATWTYPEVSLFTALQRSANHDGFMDGAGDAMTWFGFPYRMGYGQDLPRHVPVSAAFSPCGAAMMIRRSTFERLGGFDAQFYIYCEDSDLGYRARLQGDLCLLIPQAVVDHIGSATLGARSDFALYYGYRNRLWMYLKNTPGAVMVLTFVPHILLTLVMLIKDAVSGKGRPAWRGLWDALSGLGPIMVKRREIQRARTLSALRLLKVLTWNPKTIATRGLDLQEIKE